MKWLTRAHNGRLVKVGRSSKVEKGEIMERRAYSCRLYGDSHCRVPIWTPEGRRKREWKIERDHRHRQDDKEEEKRNQCFALLPHRENRIDTRERERGVYVYPFPSLSESIMPFSNDRLCSPLVIRKYHRYFILSLSLDSFVTIFLSQKI